MNWIRTRSKRDLVLALAVAGGFVVLVGSFVMARTAGYDSDERHAHSQEHEHDFDFDFEFASAGGVAFDQAFEVRPGARLQVKLGDADVSVAATSGSEARVILYVDGDEVSSDLLAELGFSVRASESGLTIETEENDRGWGDHDDADLRLEVTVPREFDIAVWTGDGDVSVDSFEGEIHIQTGDGDVALGVASGRALRIQTGDGDVAVAGATSREILIQTGDGDVAVQRLEGDEIQIRTGDGDIMLQELAGRFRASTGDGDVQVHVVRFEGLDIRSGDGDITIYAPAGLSADVELSGSEFVIGEAFALPVTLDRRSLEGILNGGGEELSVRVGDGTIRLIER